jgi:hypothetical protein
VSLYALHRREWLQAKTAGLSPQKAIEFRRSLGPGMSFERELVLPFGETDWYSAVGEERHRIRAETGVDPEYRARVEEPLIRTLFATWLLMGQRVAAEETLAPNRAVQRRLERTETPAAPVTIVTLRRPEPPDREDVELGGSDTNWSCRWTVHEHWHWYWCGSKGRRRRRLMFVSDYVKGPEDKPLKESERVHVLSR